MSCHLSGGLSSQLRALGSIHPKRYILGVCGVILAGIALQNTQPTDARAQGASCSICVSQAFGGGGNKGAPLNADFVELFNTTANQIALDGWSMEYAAATSSSWQSVALDGKVVAPYAYLLIQLKSGAEGGDLPIADLQSSINMAADSGKVRLLSSGVTVDLLGYGSANEFEGQPAPKGSNTESLLRGAAGCIDTDNNSSDFAKGSPAPRNSAAPSSPCVAEPTPTLPETETPTATPTSTDTATPVDTVTPTPTDTVTPAPTETPTVTPTAELAPTETATPTPVDTVTSTPTPESTPTGIPTATATTPDEPTVTLEPTSTPTLDATALPPPTPTGTPTPTDVVTPTSTPEPLPTLTATPTATETPTSLPTPSPTPTATPTPVPRIRLSEIMVDPQAIEDASGEFVELTNIDVASVNLLGWRMTDSANRTHVILSDLWIAPGDYLILARGDPVALDSYLHTEYRYSALQFANTAGSLSLFAPESFVPVDSVTWGASVGLAVRAGASFERVELDAYSWTIATAPWTDAHTDKGSPGSGFSEIQLPTPTPTQEAPTPELTVAPTITLPTPTPTAGSDTRIRLSEIMVDPRAVDDAVGEFIELANAGTRAVNLQGWSLVDGGNRSHTIATALWIEPGAFLILTRSDEASLAGYVRSDYRYASLQLANTSGAVALFAPGSAAAGTPTDQVVWGEAVGLRPQSGASFERIDLNADRWVVAAAPWSNSHGDMGSPGVGSTIVPTPTPTATGMATPTGTPPTPIVFPTPTPTPGPAPRIRLSEIMIDPQAVEDAIGEFVEVANLGAADVNLHGWRLVDGAGRTHIIGVDLWIQPNAYLVLTRGDAPAAGYARMDYRYAALQFANTNGAIALYASDSADDAPPVDRFVWGDAASLRPQSGASFERVDLATDQWVVAATPWSGAHTDKGSPGAAYTGAPLPAPSPTPAPTQLSEAWQPTGNRSALQIDEVHFQGSDGEFVALINLGTESVILTDWMLGDAETPGDGEGIYKLPVGATLLPGEIYVIARKASHFRATYGRLLDAEFEPGDVDVPDLPRVTHLGRGTLALDDTGDELVLLNPSGLLVDGVAYKGGDYAALSLEGAFSPAGGLSLQRVPGADFATNHDVRHRFLAAPPRPYERRDFPLEAVHDAVRLGGPYQAVWGSLGGASNFSAGYTAPPHYLLAEAAAQNLDFMAISDPTPVEPAQAIDGVAPVQAWRWTDDADEVIVYSAACPAESSRAALDAYLVASGAAWQIVNGSQIFHGAPLLSVAADAPPSGMKAWFAAWKQNGAPALPAGNSNPNLPGIPQRFPVYTGLAVSSLDAAGIQEALQARRGWVTSAPGMWLTLEAQPGNEESVWMGNWLEPANQVTLRITYGDRSGEVAGLAIWQDGMPMRQLDLPPADGRWTVTLPAVPGAIFTAVATQFDGDFAITAPFFVRPADSGPLLLNEVLPAPRNDFNGDGVVDGDDEYVELYNLGANPFPLAGWTLLDGDDDAMAHHMTFGLGRYLGGGEHLLLLRKNNRLSLRNDGGVVRLLDPEGVERDRVTWDADLVRGRSVSRLPDGGDWVWNADATPGQPNRNTGVDNFAPWPNTPPSPPNHAPSVSPAAEATAGQAGGPPGSIAQSKLAGLGASVEFRAIVVAPPGLFNSSIYVADITADGATAGIGVNVYLRRGEFPPLAAGDLVLLRGRLDSFRGETELVLDSPDQIWRIEGGAPLEPLPTRAGAIGESLEGRLVTFRGVVTGWQGDSIFLGDPADPLAEPVRVTVRTTLSWKRPYVQMGQVWQATGDVSQFAREDPWNGGYRILVRWQRDLVRVE